MFDLALHSQREEDAEVDQKDGPEHGDVKDAEQSAEERDHYGACRRVPAYETSIETNHMKTTRLIQDIGKFPRKKVASMCLQKNNKVRVSAAVSERGKVAQK